MKSVKPLNIAPPTPPALQGEELVVTIDRQPRRGCSFRGRTSSSAIRRWARGSAHPPAPMVGVPNPKAAIRYALNHPEGTDPLHAQLSPGMKVTIALDDISLPLPPMRTPDLRQLILEIVLELCADSGVDDIHLIIANSLHRRMTGRPRCAAWWGTRFSRPSTPSATTTTTPKTRKGSSSSKRTEATSEVVALNRRATESDLLTLRQHQPGPHGRGREIASGWAGQSTRACSAHHNLATIRQTATPTWNPSPALPPPPVD